MLQLVDFFGTTQVQWILILIGIDVVLGVLGAVVKKEFRFGRLAAFMHQGVLAYVFGFVVLEMAAQALPQLGFAVPVAFILVLASILASCVRNLKKLGFVLPFAEKM